MPLAFDRGMAHQRKAARPTGHRTVGGNVADQGYYISQRWRQLGPFTREDLEALGIKRNTLVWDPANWVWRPAETVEALAEILHPRGALAHLKAVWKRMVGVFTHKARHSLSGA